MARYPHGQLIPIYGEESPPDYFIKGHVSHDQALAAVKQYHGQEELADMARHPYQSHQEYARFEGAAHTGEFDQIIRTYPSKPEGAKGRGMFPVTVLRSEGSDQ